VLVEGDIERLREKSEEDREGERERGGKTGSEGEEGQKKRERKGGGTVGVCMHGMCIIVTIVLLLMYSFVYVKCT